MRTTLEVDKELLEEANKLSGEKTLGATVNKALAEYIRRSKLTALRQLLKETELADTWREDEEKELAAMQRLGQID